MCAHHQLNCPAIGGPKGLHRFLNSGRRLFYIIPHVLSPSGVPSQSHVTAYRHSPLCSIAHRQRVKQRKRKRKNQGNMYEKQRKVHSQGGPGTPSSLSVASPSSPSSRQSDPLVRRLGPRGPSGPERAVGLTGPEVFPQVCPPS